MPITLELFVSEKGLSYVCTNVGSLLHYSSSTVEHTCAMWKPYLVYHVCQIYVQFPLSPDLLQ